MKAIVWPPASFFLWNSHTSSKLWTRARKAQTQLVRFTADFRGSALAICCTAFRATNSQEIEQVPPLLQLMVSATEAEIDGVSRTRSSLHRYATHGRIQHLGRVVRQRIWCESLKVGTDDKLCRPVWRLHPQKIHSDVRWKTAKEYIVTLSAYIDCFFPIFNVWLVAGLCFVFV